MAETSLLAAMGRALAPVQKATHMVPSARGGWRIMEAFSGAWQQNVEVNRDAVLAHHAVFACMTLIASDIAKLRVKLVQQDAKTRIWTEVERAAFSPVLRKPNHLQTRIQFWESWILSKLSTGNSYVLKVRDGRSSVVRLFVLDPNRVMPLITDEGDVFYQLASDNVAGVVGSITVPAREIIHDRFNCLFHPLVGLSPIYAAGVAATQGLRIQNNSANFFGNQSQPGGILTAPGEIHETDAQRIKDYWEANFTGRNAGKIAVVGDGLKFERLGTTPHDAQMVEQLKWTGEVVCSTFHVPPYKVGVGVQPTHNNAELLNLEYYSQCLQVLIEAAELCLDEGLGMDARLGTEFDVDNLLRMDMATQLDVLDKARSVMTLDERRRRLELEPMKTGGGTVYLQQQDHSLEAIAARDAQMIDAAKNTPVAPPPAENDNTEAEAEDALAEIRRGLA